MYISQITCNSLTKDDINKILFKGIKDDLRNGDCILVFGSPSATKYRVPKAVELYKTGRGKKILFSGGKFVETSNGKIFEAIAMKNKAMELGVPEKDIIIETLSQNTKENVLCSLLELDRALGLNNINRILAVSAFFHMKRCIHTLKTYMPHWIEFSSCPATDSKVQPNNWFLTDVGRKIATTEVCKTISYVENKDIPDFKF